MDCVTDWWAFGKKSEKIVPIAILFMRNQSTVVWSDDEMDAGEKQDKKNTNWVSHIDFRREVSFKSILADLI